MKRTAIGALTVLLCSLTASGANPTLPPAIRSFFRLGGGAAIQAMGLDREGNIYVAGETRRGTHLSFAGTYAIGPGGGDSELFVVKVSADGQQVIYAVEIGGSKADYFSGMCVDANGIVTLAGFTDSADFPITPGAYREKVTLGSAVVLRLSPSGRNLAFSTYLDDSYWTVIKAIAVESSGSVVVTGYADGRTFPTTEGALQRGPIAAEDQTYRVGFVARLSTDGRALLSSTLFGGGHGSTSVSSIAIDRSGTLHMVGAADSLDLLAARYGPHPAGPQRSSGPYLARLNNSLSQVLFCTWIQESQSQPLVAVDALSNSYVAGGHEAMAVEKYDAMGALSYSKQYGGAGLEQPVALAVLDDGGLVLAGGTTSPDFPTRDTLLPCTTGSPEMIGGPSLSWWNAFAVRLNASGAITHSSLLGVENGNTFTALARSSDTSIYLAGFSPTALPFNRPDFIYFPSALESSVMQFDLSAVVTGRPSPSCLVNSASFEPSPVSPGAFATLFGSNLGTAAGAQFQLGPDGRVPTELSGVRVTVGGLAAPITYAQDNQINFLVPQAVTGESAEVCVASASGQGCVTTKVQPLGARIFKVGAGYAVLNQDGTLNTAESPAPRGSIIALWGTGFGPYDHAIPDGALAAPPFGKLAYPIKAVFGAGGCDTSKGPPPSELFQGQVMYAGAAPGLVNGVTQINVRVPEGTDHYCGWELGLSIDDPMATGYWAGTGFVVYVY